MRGTSRGLPASLADLATGLPASSTVSAARLDGMNSELTVI
jgi:hypothetical protein